jgi:hypothetical protein
MLTFHVHASVTGVAVVVILEVDLDGSWPKNCEYCEPYGEDLSIMSVSQIEPPLRDETYSNNAILSWPVATHSCVRHD